MHFDRPPLIIYFVLERFIYVTKPWEILIWRGAPKPWEVSTYSNEKLRWTVSNRRFPHFQCQPQRERLSVFASRGGVESPRVRRSGRGGSTSRPRSGVRRPRAAPGARLARFAALTAGKRRRTPRTEREAGVQRRPEVSRVIIASVSKFRKSTRSP